MIRFTPESIGKKVTMNRDFDSVGIRRGDVGTIVEYVGNAFFDEERTIRVRVGEDTWRFTPEELDGYNDTN